MTAESPLHITWSKALFPEGSLGQAIFPEVLEGRDRSSAFLDRPARNFIYGIKRWALIEDANINTVGHLLVTEETIVSSWLKRPQVEHLRMIREKLYGGLLRAAMGPEDLLMAAIFGAREPSEILIPPPQESDRRVAIMDVLESLPYSHREIIQERFGIFTYTPKSWEQVGREHTSTREKIRQIEAKALRFLRHPSRSRRLKEFLPSEEMVASAEIPKVFRDFLQEELGFQ